MNQELEHQLSELMVKAQKGDEAAYSELLRQVADLVRAFVRMRLSCSNSVEDIVQETLLSIHKARHTYRAVQPFSPWMYAIAGRRLADHFRTTSRTIGREIYHDGLLHGLVAQEGPQLGSTDSVLIDALCGLPPKQRHVIELLKVGSLSIREVARRLKMTEGAVKVTAHRGYEALRKKLKKGSDGH